jgi:hypothetical protein
MMGGSAHDTIKAQSLAQINGRKPPLKRLYCFAAGGFASGAGAGAEGSSVGAVPRSSDAVAQLPAQSLVPLTVPTSLQPSAAFGFT